MDLRNLCQNAKNAKNIMANLETEKKNAALRSAAEALRDHAQEIIDANQLDLDHAKEIDMPQSLVDRLMLNEARIEGMAKGLEDVAELADPIGQVLSMTKRPNDLIITKKSCAIGVIGIIFEARPNVAADAFGLCFKSGNCVILKGGKEAIHSTIAIIAVIRESLKQSGIPEDVCCLIEDTNRETTTAFMKMNGYVDLLIPRGGHGLIQAVVANATVPVIETGTGNCHIYVDETADLKDSVNIINNAKTQRIGVCNAAESLVVHSAIAAEALPLIYEELAKSKVEMRCDERSYEILKGRDNVVRATEEDFGTEYLDYIISVKTVDSTEEAVDHINRYNTGHSETIMTKNYDNAQYFLNHVDAACVYLNASTRFSDGGEFGFGAEIGISTQKLHARGPMGLEALTSYKYIIFGDGQIRK